MNSIPQGLYISPMIKGQGIAPPLYERLDDLVQSGERVTLENLLRWALRRLPQADEASIQE